jgi:carbon storage regulator
MLVLSRRPQQSFVIGHDIVITVLEVNGDTVRLGIAAPRDVDIHREEVYRELQQANTTAASPPSEAVAAFTRRASAAPQQGSKAQPVPTPQPSRTPPPDGSTPQPGEEPAPPGQH